MTHVGKLYNLCASLIAQRLVTEIPEIAAAQCFMVSEIGRPIDQPQIIDIRVEPVGGRRLNVLRRAIQAVASGELETMPQLAASLLDGDIGIDRWPLGAADPTFGPQRWRLEADQGRAIDHAATDDFDLTMHGQDVRCRCN